MQLASCKRVEEEWEGGTVYRGIPEAWVASWLKKVGVQLFEVSREDRALLAFSEQKGGASKR
jgi:hypothetical protein